MHELLATHKSLVAYDCVRPFCMVGAGAYAHSFSFLTLAKISGDFVSNPSLPRVF
jgi:hypothetical protein